MYFLDRNIPNDYLSPASIASNPRVTVNSFLVPCTNYLLDAFYAISLSMQFELLLCATCCLDRCAPVPRVQIYEKVNVLEEGMCEEKIYGRNMKIPFTDREGGKPHLV